MGENQYWLIFTAKGCSLLTAKNVDPAAEPLMIKGETGRKKISASMAKRWKKMMKRPQ
jgi:hypothetical protein